MMKPRSSLLINLVNEVADYSSVPEVIEQFFPGMSVGELISDMYDHGMIPEDVLEEFLNELEQE